MKHSKKCKLGLPYGCTCGAILENMTESDWRKLELSQRKKAEEFEAEKRDFWKRGGYSQ